VSESERERECVCVKESIESIARARSLSLSLSHTHTHTQVGWPASTAVLTVYGSESEKWWSANWKGSISFTWDASY